MFKVKQDWMMTPSKRFLKVKDQILGVELYGLNPHSVSKTKLGFSVNTELYGGDIAARECFKNLTGRYPKDIEDYDFRLDGVRIDYRALGNSEHPKIEINGKAINGMWEKITFK